jgi:hypothetical protein
MGGLLEFAVTAGAFKSELPVLVVVFSQAFRTIKVKINTKVNLILPIFNLPILNYEL